MLTKNNSKITKPSHKKVDDNDWKAMDERNTAKMTDKIVQELGEPEEKFQ